MILLILGTVCESRTIKSTTLTCEFEVREEEYGCYLSNIKIENGSSIVIRGDHLAGKGDEDVKFLEILSSIVEKIPEELFKKFRNLETFGIINSRLDQIELPECSQVRTLQFTSCQLEKIKEEAFKRCTNLEKLQLSYNRLENFHSNILNGLSNLKFLDLFDNKLTWLSSNFFKHIPNIAKLDVGFNRIDAIHPRTFENLKKLNSVWLDGNICVSRSFSFLEVGNAEPIKDHIEKCFAL